MACNNSHTSRSDVQKRKLRFRRAVEDVVGFVLREALPEALVDEVGPRMALEREVLPADGVEKVEADGKLRLIRQSKETSSRNASSCSSSLSKARPFSGAIISNDQA